MSAESFHAHGDNHNDGVRNKDELALEKAAVEVLRSNEFGADEFNLLSEDDMHIFGLNPLTDILNLVSCNVCQKPVIESQFSAHYKRCISSLGSDQPHAAAVSQNVEWGKGKRKARSWLPSIREEGQGGGDQSDSKRSHVLEAEKTTAPDHERSKKKVERHLHAVEGEVPERCGQSDSFSRLESPRSRSKRSSARECALVSVESSEVEARRPGLRGRKRDGSAVCSTSLGHLETPAPRKRKQDFSAVAPSHPALRGLRTRQVYTKLGAKEGRDDVEKVVRRRKRDTCIDTVFSAQQGRKAARSVRLHRKQDSKSAESKLGEVLTKGRQKRDINPDDRKGGGGARGLRRQRREKVKDQSSVENANNGVSKE